MCPGYLGATLAQRRQLAGQGPRMARVLPFAALGGIAGALLLLVTDPRAFDVVVPFLLVFASLLLAGQERLRRWLIGRTRHAHASWWAALPVGIASIYGGYFGAGLGVIVLAALAIVLADSLVRVNALKQTVSLVVNGAAAGVYVISGRVDWSVAGVMFVGSLIGGAIGGAIAARVPGNLLRWLVVTVGLAVAGIYFAKLL